MKDRENARASVIKMLIICIVVIFCLTVVTKAGNVQISNVNIKLSNNSEINVMTSKTKISEILEENHIIVLPEEIVTPSLNEQIKEDKIIKISKQKEKEVKIAEVTNTELNNQMAEILDSYIPIVEKIIIEQVEVPFETITKDISNGSESTTSKVLQEGINGIREITYNVKYKNDIEVEKTEISSVVIREPVNKVVQVTVFTSRAGARVATTNPAVESATSIASRVEGITPYVMSMNTSAYCACMSCCGKTNGITSSGAHASEWYTVAAGSGYKIGTVIYIPYFSNQSNGGWFVVQDRGGAISNSKLDIYMGSHGQAIQFGRKTLECYVYEF